MLKRTEFYKILNVTKFSMLQSVMQALVPICDAACVTPSLNQKGGATSAEQEARIIKLELESNSTQSNSIYPNSTQYNISNKIRVDH